MVKRTGRPTKATPERIAGILAMLREGNTRRASCLCNGISETTFANWLAENSDFLDAVNEAEAFAEKQSVAKVRNDDSWQASAWWLERRKHEDYARRDKTELGGTNGGPLRVTIVSALAAALDGEVSE